MRLVTQTGRDLSAYFDIIDESEIFLKLFFRAPEHKDFLLKLLQEVLHYHMNQGQPIGIQLIQLENFNFISCSSNINTPLYLITAHQKTQRTYPTSTTDPPANPSNNRFNYAIFDIVAVKKYYVEIDG